MRGDLDRRLEALAEASGLAEEVFAASGKATLYSYVINHRPRPDMGKEPHSIAVVELAEASGLAEGRLPDEAVERARAVVARAGERLGLGLESTVVALAGPTGAGKSRLFNALAGEDLAAVGRRRPTTSTG